MKERPVIVCTPVHVRWMIRRDMAEVLEIENQSFDYAWEEVDFLRTLRIRSCIGMVAEVIGRKPPEPVVGFMIWELHKRQIELLNLAVHPSWRRQGVGWQMVQRVKDKLSSCRRTRLGAMVRETNLDAQLFLKAQGFTATRIERGFYDDTAEDAIRFVHRVPVFQEIGGEG